MKITIIGAGNVATHLALAIKKAGHEIVQIYNRSDDAGKELAHAVGASFTSDARKLKDAEVYLVAVKDDVIAEVVTHFKMGDKVIAHTSGTKSKDLLKTASSSYGIFYPLQTLSRQTKVDFRYVPMLVEASNEAAAKKLEQLASSISHNVYKVDEEQRQWIHIAAVFANNFTNHLFALSDDILKRRGMSFDILKPLIFKFLQNLHENSPGDIQTGPAARRDKQTIKQHLHLLEDDKRLHEIYKVLTDSIIKDTPAPPARKK